MGTIFKTSHIQPTLAISRIQLQRCVSSKKKALEHLSTLLASDSGSLDPDTIFNALVAREKLGGTALEHGVALPHARIAECTQPVSALITLENGVDFDARDNQAVTVLWALIVPNDANETHLNLLADIASLLSDADKLNAIKTARDSTALNQQLFCK